VNGLLGVLTSGTSGAGRVIGSAVQSVLTASYSTFLPGTATTATTLGTATSSALTLVFGSDGVLALSVNAQNAPQSGNNPVPAALAALPAGRYDVGAMRAEIRARAGAVSAVVGRWIMLAGASVGPSALRT
jgi:hypothetical protein